MQWNQGSNTVRPAGGLGGAGRRHEHGKLTSDSAQGRGVASCLVLGWHAPVLAHQGPFTEARQAATHSRCTDPQKWHIKGHLQKGTPGSHTQPMLQPTGTGQSVEKSSRHRPCVEKSSRHRPECGEIKQSRLTACPSNVSRTQNTHALTIQRLCVDHACPCLQPIPLHFLAFPRLGGVLATP